MSLGTVFARAPVDGSQDNSTAPAPQQHHQKPPQSRDGPGTFSHGPLYSDEQRAFALALLMPSLSDAVLGAGWDEVPSPPTPSSPTLDASSPSSSSFSGPSTPPSEPSATVTPAIDYHRGKTSAATTAAASPPSSSEEHSDALLVRSCRQGWDRSFELHSHWPRPRIQAADEVLIRTVSVGLNPVDWKSVSYNFGIADWPWVLGRDVAGIVEQVGPAVQLEQRLKVGDRVWTCADSRDSRAGAYQRFCIAKADTVGMVPDTVKDREAATIGTGLVTAAVVLYWFFRLPSAVPRAGTTATPIQAQQQRPPRLPASSLQDKWILIYGGGAVTGIYAAQLAALSGLRVLSIASPSNFDYLASIGVQVCLDRYGSPESILEQVDERTGGRLAFAIDCVGSKTANLCYQALTRAHGLDKEDEGQLVCLAGNPKTEFIDQVSTEQPAPQTKVKLHKISFSTTFYGDATFSRSVLDEIHTLLKSKRLHPVRPEVIPDGLAGIRRGLEALRDGTAPRAKKLVVDIADTPSADLTHLGVRTDLGWNGVV